MPVYELFCGITTSLIISPVMTLIDTSIIKAQIKNQNFALTVSEIIRDYTNKTLNLRKPFKTMYFVYGATYSTANLTDLYCEKHGLSKNLSFFMTSLVNVCSIIYKDIEYTKIFNTKKTVFPKISYGLFAIRDSLTIFSTFTLKKDLIPFLDKYMPHNTSAFIASFSLPVLFQFISTPIHILAIDVCNNPSSSIHERIKNIRYQYTSICLGRVIRVVPAFCIGGFINDMLRNRTKLQQQ
jgi:hypothetical protein